jgi:transcriptional regulator with XRE-family HTH domain
VLRLRFERLAHQSSQHRLALATGIPQPVLSLIETRWCNPTPEQLATLGRVLHVEPPELLLQDVVLPTSDAEAAR